MNRSPITVLLLDVALGFNGGEIVIRNGCLRITTGTLPQPLLYKIEQALSYFMIEHGMENTLKQ